MNSLGEVLFAVLMVLTGITGFNTIAIFAIVLQLKKDKSDE